MITVRKMVFADVDAVSQLEEQTFSMPWSRNAFWEMVDRTDAVYLVAEENNVILGVCGVLNMAGDGEITNVAVNESVRRKGIAKLMLTKLLDEGTKLGITAFTLEVRKSNLPATGLYEKLGFENVGIRPNFYDKPNEDAVIMWKR
ncbi:MAG: ribosomal protein S18-alanine N-acetyltransferase [Lachnospiraceae bacterium]|nr:ribosomal protein S18-alanine N-acetyltransferase [Lachnospiraceae bacterium]